MRLSFEKRFAKQRGFIYIDKSNVSLLLLLINIWISEIIIDDAFI